ncbi:MerR family transcriptional regulator [Candidatus Saccharibacteria bacterium]|nr:MerR family transcriptional regulator [Candidatus Saccharibacteria bacterium]
MRKTLLPISEAANYLGVSTKTLRRWEKQGRISPYRTRGNQRRYTLAALDAVKPLVRKRKSTPKPQFEPPLTISEAAEELGDKLKTLRVWEKEEGTPVPLRTSGGQRRYLPTDVKLIQAKGKVPPSKPPETPVRRIEDYKPRRRKTPLVYAFFVFLILALAAGWVTLPTLTRERIKRAFIPGPVLPIVDVNDALEYQGAGGIVTALKAKYPLETSSLVTEVLRATNDAILNTSRFLGTVFFGRSDEYYVTPAGDAVLKNLTTEDISAHFARFSKAITPSAGKSSERGIYFPTNLGGR